MQRYGAPLPVLNTGRHVLQTDIFQDSDGLTLMMEMLGVKKIDVSIDIQENRLSIKGKIDFSNHEDMEPIYTEQGIGHHKRSFTLSNQIDQVKISASLNDGVLERVLPVAEAAKPRAIQIS